MRLQDTVLHALLKQISWERFEKLVKKHGADARVRELDSRMQLIVLLYGQFAGATSLREIVLATQSHAARLAPLGAGAVARSTLSDANQLRPAALFAELFTDLLAQAHRGLRRKGREALRLIDATRIRLSTLSAYWAQAAKNAVAAKLHVVLDPNADCPVYFAVSTARVNDITAAKKIPIEPGALYVFDLGYYDFAWWAELDDQGCCFVTRLKKNTPLTVVTENQVPKGSNILSDRIGFLPERLASSRRNPFQQAVREIRVEIETGTILRLVSNDLDSPAEEIAEIYKRRWAIELFFRWMKQTLKIKHFVGHSENAVRIQLTVALIAFLLLRTAQAAHRIVESPLAFARLIRANLMHDRPIHRLHEPEDPSPPVQTENATRCGPKQLCSKPQYSSTGQPWNKSGHDELIWIHVVSFIP
jgi:hypothetical protein